MSIPIPPEIGQNIAIRMLGVDEAAVLPLAMEFTKPMEKAQAQAFLAKVQAATGALPGSAAAQKLRAEVELDADAFADAETSADRAIAIAPDDARAHYLKGAAVLGRADAAGEDRAALIKAARKEIITANKLDSDDPLPLIAFYRLSAMSGSMPQIAIDAIARAHQIVPQDFGTRMTYARLLIDQGNGARAIALLKPIASDPHGGPGSAEARKLIAQIEAGGAKAAVAPAPQPAPAPH